MTEGCVCRVNMHPLCLEDMLNKARAEEKAIWLTISEDAVLAARTEERKLCAARIREQAQAIGQMLSDSGAGTDAFAHGQREQVQALLLIARDIEEAR